MSKNTHFEDFHDFHFFRKLSVIISASNIFLEAENMVESLMAYMARALPRPQKFGNTSQPSPLFSQRPQFFNVFPQLQIPDISSVPNFPLPPTLRHFQRPRISPTSKSQTFSESPKFSEIPSASPKV